MLPKQVTVSCVHLTSYGFLQTPPLASDALAIQIVFPLVGVTLLSYKQTGLPALLGKRKSVSIFNKRYFFVFLLGRDFRQQLRSESPIALFIMTLLTSLGVMSLFSLAVITLYLIKSALGIDIFHNFSFGIWDWFKELMNIT